MTFARVLAALCGSLDLTLPPGITAVRRHRLSAASTALLLSVSASLFGASVPLTLALWGVASLVSLELWRRCEPFILRRLGCRSPSHLECERLEPALAAAHATLNGLPGDGAVQVLDRAEPWLGIGFRTLVLTPALLDLFDDRALVGMLAQATEQMRSASLPGELLVWLGNAPLVFGWRVSRWLVILGRLLAIAVGASLVLPLLLCPVGFTRWVGRLFGAVCVGLLGSTLLSRGFAGVGVCLLLGWVLVPGLSALLAWERRRAETAADDATLAAGLGWQLVEALETLAWAASLPAPEGPFGWLSQPGTPIGARAARIWETLSKT